jgi:hypothetical protein
MRAVESTQSPPLDEQALEEISAADRDWFVAHPGRSMRLRHPHKSECLPDWRPDLTLVVQVEPGFRLRIPYQAEKGVAYQQYPESTTERLCQKVWAEMQQAFPNHPAVKITLAHAAGTW